MVDKTTLLEIIDLARWAPSGDNTQPWRFELVSDTEMIVHGFDTREHCVYDLDGMPSRLAHGALLETISIAASGFGLLADFEFLPTGDSTKPAYRVTISHDKTVSRSSLFDSIKVRVTQRRPMKMGGLDAERKQALTDVLTKAGGQVIWFDQFTQRLAVAKLLFRSAWIRLVTREAYEVHRSVIDWGKQYSDHALPDQALGADALTLRLMRWAMQDWRRVEVMNRFFAGTVAPRVQLDFLPGLNCAAHFALVAPSPLAIDQSAVEAGRLLQRFWLEVTRQAMYLQPEMTPLIFTRYVRKGIPFTQHLGAQARASRVAAELSALLGDVNKFDQVFFFGRVGFGSQPPSRSLRLAPERLLLPG